MTNFEACYIGWSRYGLTRFDPVVVSAVFVS
jgi:hypothetical protein